MLTLSDDTFIPTTKAQTSPDKFLRSTVQVIDGMGQNGAKPRPFSHDRAVKQFCSWAYAGLMLNANAFASVPLRMYTRKRAGRKLYGTRAVTKSRRRYLTGEGEHRPSEAVRRKVVDFGSDFEEVTEPHPALQVLSQVNPWQNGYDLSVLRCLYWQATGNAYVHPVMDRSLARPAELWLMPSQWTQVIPDTKGDEFIRGYLYGRRPDQREFAADEVIQWKMPSLEDVYYGKGTVEALWSALSLHNAKRTMDVAKFDNFARPDWLLVVKGGAGEGALDRLETTIETKLRGAKNSGRFMSVQGDVEAIPLNFDVLEIGDPDKVIQEIAAVIRCPLYKLQGNDPIKANSETADYAWLRDTILPFCRMDEEQLNARYLPLFGIEDDAVLAYDNPIPEDKVKDTTLRVQRAGGPYTTVNEEREEEGMEPVDGGDEIRNPPMDPQTALLGLGMAAGRAGTDQQVGPDGKPVNPAEAVPPDQAGNIETSQATVLNGAQVTAATSIVIAVAAGEIPRDAGIGQLEVLFNLSNEQAERIMGSAGTNTPTTPNPNPAKEAAQEAANAAQANAPSGGQDGDAPGGNAGGPAGKAVAKGRNVVVAEPQLQVAPFPEAEPLIAILRTAFTEQRKAVLAGIELADRKCTAKLTQTRRTIELPRDAGDYQRYKGAGKVTTTWKGATWQGEVKEYGDEFAVTASYVQHYYKHLFDGEPFDEASWAIAMGVEAPAIKARADRPAPASPPLIDLPASFVPLNKWTSSIAQAARPVIEIVMRERAREVLTRVGASADVAAVVDRNIPVAAERLALKFAKSTNETTTLQLTEAKEKLRQEIADGIVEGDGREEMTKRVQEVFDQADKERAETIARTETTRAQGDAGLTSAKESRVVSGKYWMASGDACDECLALAAMGVIPLEKSFTTTDYGAVDHAPLHPSCRCSEGFSVRDDLGKP